MGTRRISRTAAFVVMTSALAWNLPVLAQEDSENLVQVTVLSDAMDERAIEGEVSDTSWRAWLSTARTGQPVS